MKLRAKISLCTPTGTVQRGAEFDASDEQAAKWIAQGKARAVEEGTASAQPRRGKTKARAVEEGTASAQPRRGKTKARAVDTAPSTPQPVSSGDDADAG
ncbi:hypothetical protein [Sphingomonas koreensis]|nr:hypothetical protein [Sphingomonas koreensis]